MCHGAVLIVKCVGKQGSVVQIWENKQVGEMKWNENNLFPIVHSKHRIVDTKQILMNNQCNVSNYNDKKTCGRPQTSRKTRFVDFCLPLMWGSTDQRRKLAVLLCPRDIRSSKLKSPGGSPQTIKLGRGHTGYNQKAELRTRHSLICGSGPQVQRCLHR
jgi:hypothetical protein